MIARLLLLLVCAGAVYVGLVNDDGGITLLAALSGFGLGAVAA